MTPQEKHDIGALAAQLTESLMNADVEPPYAVMAVGIACKALAQIALCGEDPSASKMQEALAKVREAFDAGLAQTVLAVPMSLAEAERAGLVEPRVGVPKKFH